MAEKCVVVERDLGIEREQLAVLGDHQRIDLQKAHVLGDEGRIETLDQRAALLGGKTVEVQGLGDAQADVGGIADDGIDMGGVDLLRRFFRHLLDVHAAFGGKDEGNAADRAVDQYRKVQLPFDGGTVLDVKPPHEAPVRPGLVGVQRHAQHGACLLFDVGQRADRLDPAPLAAAAGMNLRLDHPNRSAQFAGGGNRLFRGEGRTPAQNRNTEGAKDVLGLIFVDVHRRFPEHVIVRRKNTEMLYSLLCRASCRKTGFRFLCEALQGKARYGCATTIAAGQLRASRLGTF